ncbi:hypothetical protein DFH09DRAFT_1103735 [Mycena vulgaris]|nr:hypothetical protein DFH09DRAFT_1103735 [Mycena vulgaris]
MIIVDINERCANDYVPEALQEVEIPATNLDLGRPGSAMIETPPSAKIGQRRQALPRVTPVPGLSFAWNVFKFIVSYVMEVNASKEQLQVLAQGIGQLGEAACAETTQRSKDVASHPVVKDSIRAFSTISALLNVQRMLRDDGSARRPGKNALDSHLKSLENSQLELRQTLDITQQTIIAMMVSIERRLGGQRNDSA